MWRAHSRRNDTAGLETFFVPPFSAGPPSSASASALVLPGHGGFLVSSRAGEATVAEGLPTWLVVPTFEGAAAADEGEAVVPAAGWQAVVGAGVLRKALALGEAAGAAPLIRIEAVSAGGGTAAEPLVVEVAVPPSGGSCFIEESGDEPSFVVGCAGFSGGVGNLTMRAVIAYASVSAGTPDEPEETRPGWELCCERSALAVDRAFGKPPGRLPLFRFASIAANRTVYLPTGRVSVAVGVEDSRGAVTWVQAGTGAVSVRRIRPPPPPSPPCWLQSSNNLLVDEAIFADEIDVALSLAMASMVQLASTGLEECLPEGPALEVTTQYFNQFVDREAGAWTPGGGSVLSREMLAASFWAMARSGFRVDYSLMARLLAEPSDPAVEHAAELRFAGQSALSATTALASTTGTCADVGAALGAVPRAVALATHQWPSAGVEVTVQQAEAAVFTARRLHPLLLGDAGDDVVVSAGEGDDAASATVSSAGLVAAAAASFGDPGSAPPVLVAVWSVDESVADTCFGKDGSDGRDNEDDRDSEGGDDGREEAAGNQGVRGGRGDGDAPPMWKAHSKTLETRPRSRLMGFAVAEADTTTSGATSGVPVLVSVPYEPSKDPAYSVCGEQSPLVCAAAVFAADGAAELNTEACERALPVGRRDTAAQCACGSGVQGSFLAAAVGNWKADCNPADDVQAGTSYALVALGLVCALSAVAHFVGSAGGGGDLLYAYATAMVTSLLLAGSYALSSSSSLVHFDAPGRVTLQAASCVLLWVLASVAARAWRWQPPLRTGLPSTDAMRTAKRASAVGVALSAVLAAAAAVAVRVLDPGAERDLAAAAAAYAIGGGGAVLSLAACARVYVRSARRDGPPANDIELQALNSEGRPGAEPSMSYSVSASVATTTAARAPPPDPRLGRGTTLCALLAVAVFGGVWAVSAAFESELIGHADAVEGVAVLAAAAAALAAALGLVARTALMWRERLPLLKPGSWLGGFRPSRKEARRRGAADLVRMQVGQGLAAAPSLARLERHLAGMLPPAALRNSSMAPPSVSSFAGVVQVVLDERTVVLLNSKRVDSRLLASAQGPRGAGGVAEVPLALVLPGLDRTPEHEFDGAVFGGPGQKKRGKRRESKGGGGGGSNSSSSSTAQLADGRRKGGTVAETRQLVGGSGAGKGSGGADGITRLRESDLFGMATALTDELLLRMWQGAGLATLPCVGRRVLLLGNPGRGFFAEVVDAVRAGWSSLHASMLVCRHTLRVSHRDGSCFVRYSPALHIITVMAKGEDASAMLVEMMRSVDAVAGMVGVGTHRYVLCSACMRRTSDAEVREDLGMCDSDDENDDADRSSASPATAASSSRPSLAAAHASSSSETDDSSDQYYCLDPCAFCMERADFKSAVTDDDGTCLWRLQRALGNPVQCRARLTRVTRVELTSGSAPTALPQDFNLAVLDQSELLGIGQVDEGHFGWVFRAVWRQRLVVVKVPKFGRVDLAELHAFLMFPRHPNLVPVYGVCRSFRPPQLPDGTAADLCLVIPYARAGSLLNVLRRRKAGGSPLSACPGSVLRAATDVCRALMHLHAQQFVHRDLAARNILCFDRDEDPVLTAAEAGGGAADPGGAAAAEVPPAGGLGGPDGAAPGEEVPDGARFCLADFGMSRKWRNAETPAHVISYAASVPARWLAPEALEAHSSASDMWMFAMTLWEVLLDGEAPFPSVRRSEDVRTGVSAGTLSPDAALDLFESLAQRGDGRHELVYRCLRLVFLACTERETARRPDARGVLAVLQMCRRELDAGFGSTQSLNSLKTAEARMARELYGKEHEKRAKELLERRARAISQQIALGNSAGTAAFGPAEVAGAAAAAADDDDVYGGLTDDDDDDKTE